MKQRRPVLTESAVLAALAHPVRLDVLNYLMSAGPATASVCARAVGDTPSNCSYHLRVLARLGLVEADESGDGRERPWRATVTGFSIEDPPPGAPAAGSEAGAGDPAGAALLAASLQLDQRLARDYLAGREQAPPEWRAADAYSAYTLRATPRELAELVAQLDALIRPLIAATRDDPPAHAELVHVGVQAFPRLSRP
jgi:DNA-binding transcriptional ArsR family regulator